MTPDPIHTLADLKLGTRVVVRYRTAGGLTDALGYLTAIDGLTCTIQTRRGEVTIALREVFAAKQVPQEPARRRR